MDTLHTLLGAALGASLLVNMVQAGLRREDRRAAAFWRSRAISESHALLDMIHKYHALRMNSHRRDPKTGRLLPKGE